MSHFNIRNSSYGRFSRKKKQKRIQNFVERTKSPSNSNFITLTQGSDHTYATNDNDCEMDFDFGEYIPSDLLPIGFCRFVTELDFVASQLKSCKDCDYPLFLHNALGVRPYGVCGVVYIQCDCGAVNKIKLGKTHHAGQSGRGIGAFDVNTKTAAG